MAKRNVVLHDKYKSTTALYPKIDAKSLTPEAITEITRITEVVVEEQVVPNPTPTGEETNLEYITINNVTYKVPTASTQVQSNWNETDTESPAYIQNKPTIPSAQVQSNWNETDTDSPAYIQNKPIPIEVGLRPNLANDTVELDTVVDNGGIFVFNCEGLRQDGTTKYYSSGVIMITNLNSDCHTIDSSAGNYGIIQVYYSGTGKRLHCSQGDSTITLSDIKFTKVMCIYKW